MDIDIIKDKDNPFFKRKEMTLLLKHPKAATPSKAEIIKAIAGSNSVDESQIIINYILTKKGISQSIVKLNVLKEKPKEIKGGQSEAQASKTA